MVTTMTDRDTVLDAASDVRLFRVDVPDADLDDLRQRLATTR